jgi:ABC-type glycerol-3-phosphate transport system substrate-binding protein
VLRWLRWLYRANINPNVRFSDTNEDLAEQLMKRELDWISCNSAVIPILRQALGRDLGLALLPGDSEGQPARAVGRLQTISFGRDSAPAQREAAERFALFLLNDYSQNTVMTRTVGNLPVNQNVIVPVKRSEVLAAIQRSEPQAIVPSFHRAVGVRLQRQPLSRLIKQNVYGEASPEEVLQQIEALARQRGVSPARGTAPARVQPTTLME